MWRLNCRVTFWAAVHQHLSANQTYPETRHGLVYWRRFDAIPGLLQRKLGALGLTALLALPVPALVARLELIAAHVTAVWFEVPAPSRLCRSCAARPGVALHVP